MFTGIIECLGELVEIKQDQSNVHLTIKSEISNKLKVDQSVAHNGVCLTVVELDKGTHMVTAIDETMKKTNFQNLLLGSQLNLERCTKIGDRLDGHLVQGHVDGTATCLKVEEKQGSWMFHFLGDENVIKLVVEKGSICINGVSLTVVEVIKKEFSVAIIPYTYENTSFNQIKEGSTVNVEYDIVGKYVTKNLNLKG
ncbi:MAG: riboflavin synthase [Flavobacteriales bacterium]|nr:riboflavin synthase [Flavobacteriales bacterium]